MFLELLHNLQVVTRHSGVFLDSNAQKINYIKLTIHIPYNSNYKGALQNCSFIPESLGGL